MKIKVWMLVSAGNTKFFDGQRPVLALFIHLSVEHARVIRPLTVDMRRIRWATPNSAFRLANLEYLNVCFCKNYLATKLAWKLASAAIVFLHYEKPLRGRKTKIATATVSSPKFFVHKFWTLWWDKWNRSLSTKRRSETSIKTAICVLLVKPFVSGICSSRSFVHTILHPTDF